ncbi:GH92 family glycosyl hydrolase [Draconibacterium halophilum]|uniref:Glycoside hydrolase family 92 protein n=1 Tax=Draconibacterium halophilum TaxID=2706887 RepID=A0A6C0REN0_9BACT|nr:GH92 family glycosyl hydrolase [Draconibacterium halophilum]QIA08599.1 glycoside hydrolase family 92 protein [Draconibacterium halophilum]
MKNLLLFLFILISFSCSQKQQEKPVKDFTEYVDPTIGNVGHILQPTRPTVQLPNQMTRMTPDRADYMDDQISSFPLNVISHRVAQAFFIKPIAGELSENCWSKRLTWDHDLEVNLPWYYMTELIEEEVTVEYTAGKKSGIFRFQFPANQKANLLLGHYYKEGQYSFSENNAISGVEFFRNVKIYVYAEVANKYDIKKDEDNRLVVSSVADNTQALEFKYATSFISKEQAQKNFKAELEGTTFDELKNQGKLAWDKVINQIEVKGGTEAHKRSFYTALYRCYERMVDITEDGRYFSGFDNQIHQSTRPFYVDDWVWDTYLAHHPLRSILQPDVEADMLQSYVNMYEQSGWLPTFPVIYGDHTCMNGFHSTISFLDAYRKGIRNFDVATAFEGMLKNAEEATMLPWRNGEKCGLDDFYHEKGFYPALAPGEKETVQRVHPFENRQSVAITLGHSYDDWALSQMAGELGEEKVQKTFAQRASNYKKLWHPEQKMFLPKDENGNWIDIDPKFDGGMGARAYYDENNGWTYRWQTQQDINGLIELFGGIEPFESGLDQHFRESLGRSKYEFWSKLPDATGLVGQFSMGNEPSFHIPYLFNFTNSPWKTQKWTRFLLDTWFKDNVFGIPGDEDGGGMSAFVVFSAMGFYPVTPGIPEYTITSPLFEEVTINLENGNKFKVCAAGLSVEKKYIQSARLNGKTMEKPWFTHEDLMSGGVLELEMGRLPNKKLWN